MGSKNYVPKIIFMKKEKNIYACIYVSEELMLSNRTARKSNQSLLKEINLLNTYGRTEAEAWPLKHSAKSQLIQKDPDSGKD